MNENILDAVLDEMGLLECVFDSRRMKAVSIIEGILRLVPEDDPREVVEEALRFLTVRKGWPPIENRGTL
jgi:hypothetical protein